MDKQIIELIQFLKNETRIELKSVAISNILALTGDKDGIEILISNFEILNAIVLLTTDKNFVIAKDACFCLINISAENSYACDALLKSSPSNSQNTGLIQIIIKNVLDPQSELSDFLLSVLSNITRCDNPELVENVVHIMLKIDNGIFHRLVAVFSKIDFNQRKQNLNYLAAVFSNISQSSTFRNIFGGSQNRLLQRLLPFINHESSVNRRGGITGLLKNMCFDSSLHEWLFSEEVDVLPFILLPLAGNEEFDDEINEKLPLELQFLEFNKKRESDPDIRIILLECLAQLCATRNGRTYLRSKGTYEILRELHKFEVSSEGDINALRACENVVDILIRTEDEIGHDNLKEVEIPSDIVEKIEKFNDLDDK
ncbi:hypothetical protein PVAND_011642 [Polypedilum vanderplanki]|uniref:Protein HGH1 homolog n=1 Tax=Polypedilum vanderplanki TaxID=319348 RepID=A0A9J6CK87_POLVA|nr:hypothetical protein PVAND_011642 [Polypedilum vanderplanki]